MTCYYAIERDYVVGVCNNEDENFFSHVFAFPWLALVSSSAHLLFPLKNNYSNPLFYPDPVINKKRKKNERAKKILL